MTEKYVKQYTKIAVTPLFLFRHGSLRDFCCINDSPTKDELTAVFSSFALLL